MPAALREKGGWAWGLAGLWAAGASKGEVGPSVPCAAAEK